jgi:hypothetical protein
MWGGYVMELGLVRVVPRPPDWCCCVASHFSVENRGGEERAGAKKVEEVEGAVRMEDRSAHSF